MQDFNSLYGELLIKFDSKVDKVDVNHVIQQTKVLESMLSQLSTHLNQDANANANPNSKTID
jgi:hypothetical protein